MLVALVLYEHSFLRRISVPESKKGDNAHLDVAANSLAVSSVQRQHVGGLRLAGGGGVCPMSRLADEEKRGTA